MTLIAPKSLRTTFNFGLTTKTTKERRESPTKPLSIRFTKEERLALVRAAGNLSIGAYVRQAVLGDAVSAARPSKPSRTPKRPDVDKAAIGQILALLGQSEIARSLDDLAQAAAMGALPVREEVVQEIFTACLFVREVRSTLLEALTRPSSK